MWSELMRRWLRRSNPRPAGTTPRPFTPRLEALDERTLPAITASFQNGVLTVLGDSIDNTIVVGRDAAGNILVNNGDVPIAGDTAATVANTSLIDVFASNNNGGGVILGPPLAADGGGSSSAGAAPSAAPAPRS